MVSVSTGAPSSGGVSLKTVTPSSTDLYTVCASPGEASNSSRNILTIDPV